MEHHPLRHTRCAQDVEYLNHTSLKTYFPYMMGGGYVLSADLAAVILGINQQSRGHDLLKFMPNEDVSVGFWLMSVDMRRIDHQRVVRLPSPLIYHDATKSPTVIMRPQCSVRWPTSPHACSLCNPRHKSSANTF